MRLVLLKGRRLRILMHAVGWAILFIIPSYLMYIDTHDDLKIFYITALQTIAYAIIFYLNYLGLVPLLYFRNRKLVYFLSAGFIVATMSLLMGITDINLRPKPGAGVRLEGPPAMQHIQPGWPGPGLPKQNPGIYPGPKPNERRKPPAKQWPAYNFLLTSIFITGFAIGLGYSDKVILQEKQRKEAEKEKLNTELAFLKNQINPHFFFNTLNNIYSLVETSVRDGQKAILQLSKLMRYLLYETEKGDTPLSREIDFMKNYIELMKLRLSGKVSLKVDFPEIYPDVSLPPLLFLPFIENAFKHGISYQHPSFIIISMTADHEKILFECDNSLSSKTKEIESAETGIGLENIKKRLSLLYPGRHKLEIRTEENAFYVTLQIYLSRYDQ